MKFRTKLLEHQVKAVNKLSKIKVGALYMEMGTGKTRTTLELIKQRLDKGKISHVLWLCPCSVKKNLKKDIIKHIDELNEDLFTICGIQTLSSSIKENVKLLDLVKKKNVFLVVDESNLVKNHKAIRTSRIIELSKLCKYKVILNGTPITRNEADLFAQWYILDWRILGYKSFWSFSANHLEYDDYGRIRNTLNVDYLVKKIAPYTYQIKKEECLDLPEKTYETLYYDITSEQREHYYNVADDLLFKVDEMKPETIYRLFTGLQNVISGYRVDTKGKQLSKKLFFKNYMDNPRMDLLDTIIDDIDDKVLIFAVHTHEITEIVDMINKKYGKNTALPFYGEVSIKKRDINAEEFENNPNARFLVANKTCAGYGLNFQFCNYVIFYSNDWNFGTKQQAEDRVHRIGQNKNVHIIDLCADYTLDERIIKCLRRKESLVESFKNEIEQQKDKDDLFTWINKRDYRGKKYSKKMYLETYTNLED